MRQRSRSLGAYLAALPISRQKRARMGARERSQMNRLLGMAISFFGFILERGATGDSVAFCVLWVATLCLIGIGSGLGWPLGGPWATQGPPKRGARATRALN
jgi:hypothetical protein